MAVPSQCHLCTCFDCLIRDRCYCGKCSGAMAKKVCGTKREPATIGDILNDGNEQAAMELAYKLANAGMSAPLTPEQRRRIREGKDGRV